MAPVAGRLVFDYACTEEPVELQRETIMPKLSFRLRTPLWSLIIIICCLNQAAAADVAGSSDHPMLSRFPETIIVAYDQTHYDTTWLPPHGANNGKWVRGRLTWIVYHGPQGRSTLEIYKNYERALKEGGFKIGWTCKKEQCGKNFIRLTIDTNSRMMSGGERWMPGTARYLNAELDRENGPVWVSLMVYERNQQAETTIRLEIVESNSPRTLAELNGQTVGTKSVNYDEARIAVGKSANNQLAAVLDLEGKIEWRAHRYEDSSVSAFEALASFEQYFESQGYTRQFACVLQFCGKSFIRKVLDLNGNLIQGGERWSEDSEFYYIGKLVSPQKLAHTSVLTYQQPDGQTISRVLTVESQEIEFNLIAVTGESLVKEIEKSGKVAVYGIYFDTDSADIRPESAEAIGEITRMLELKPELALYVDGHTDDEGTGEYNQDLSSRRAASVVRWLVDQNGISAGRLEARGFGESAPVASNDSEEGRSWNRRVELVSK